MAESASIIQVAILLRKEGEESPTVVEAFFCDKQEMVLDKEAAIATVLSTAESHVPGKAIDRLVYKDDEGDWCTLNDRTLTDALEFATPMQGNPNIAKLEVVVYLAEEKPPQPEAEPSPPAPEAASAPPLPPMFDFIKEHIQREIKKVLGGVELSTALPHMARACLRVIDQTQEPALFSLLDVLTGFADGNLGTDDLLPNLPMVIAAVTQLPPDQMGRVIEMARQEGAAVAAELRREAAASQEAESDEKPLRSNELEVHTNVICDGCDARPIIGKRYRSLERDDYDLCEPCYESSERDPRAWKRIRSEVVGNAVQAPRGCHISDCFQMTTHICDHCERGIVGTRYACLDRPNFDLCSACYAATRADAQLGPLRFQEVPSPAAAKAAAATATKTQEPAGQPGKEDVVTEFLTERGEVTEVHAKKSQDKWIRFKSLPPLEGDFKAVRCSVKWADQGWGNRKGRVRLAVVEEASGKTHLCDLFGCAPHGQETKIKDITVIGGYKPKAGETLHFEYINGGGGGHELHIKSFEVIVNPEGPIVYPDVPSIDDMSADQMRSVLAALLQSPSDEVRARAAHLVQEEKAKAAAAAPEPTPAAPAAVPMEAEAPAAEARVSAVVLGSDPVALPDGVTWAQRDDGAGQGDATEELAHVLRGCGASQAFRLGRVVIHAGTREELPVSARVVIVNDGNVAWPERTALVVAAGEALGFEFLPLGPLGAGEAAEIHMDLRVPPKPEAGAQCSTWAIVDAACGAPLGPVVMLETVRGLP